MINFILNVIIYSFSVFGFVVFIKNIIESLDVHKENCKVIVVLNKGENNIEYTVKEIIEHIRKSGVSEGIYFLAINQNQECIKVAEKLSKSQDFNIIADENGLYNLIK